MIDNRIDLRELFILLKYKRISFFGCFFESDLVRVTAFSLSAVGGFDGESSVAHSANLLFTVIFLGQSLQGRFHSTT